MQSVSAAEEYRSDTISVFFFKISLEKGLFQSVRSQIDSYSSMRSSFTKILFFSYHQNEFILKFNSKPPHPADQMCVCVCVCVSECVCVCVCVCVSV